MVQRAKRIVAKTARAKEGVYLYSGISQVILGMILRIAGLPVDDYRDVVWTVGIGKVGVNVAA
jgi:hypothetical protein